MNTESLHHTTPESSRDIDDDIARRVEKAPAHLVALVAAIEAIFDDELKKRRAASEPLAVKKPLSAKKKAAQAKRKVEEDFINAHSVANSFSFDIDEAVSAEQLELFDPESDEMMPPIDPLENIDDLAPIETNEIDEDDESEEVIEPIEAEVVVKKPRRRILKSLGRATKWLNKTNYATQASILSKLPGRKTKEEIAARNKVRQEKYGAREDDQLIMRQRKRLARTAIRAAEWAPFMVTALAVSSPILRPFVGEIFDSSAMDMAPTNASVSIPDIHTTNGVEHTLVNTAPLSFPAPPESTISAAPGIHYDDYGTSVPMQSSHSEALNTVTTSNHGGGNQSGTTQSGGPNYTPRSSTLPSKHSVLNIIKPGRGHVPGRGNSNASMNGNASPSFNRGGSPEVIHLVTGGAGDDSSQGFLDRLHQTGAIGPNDIAIPTVSPKNMAPFTPFAGNLSTDQSVDLTKTALRTNYEIAHKQYPNAVIVEDDFSEGNMAGNDIAHEIQADGVPVHVNAYGNPESAIGMQNKSSAANPIVAPVMNSLGIVEHPDIADTTNYDNHLDMWGTSGGDGLLTTAKKGFKIPTNHIPEDVNHKQPIQTFNVGPEKYVIFGDDNGQADANEPIAVPDNATNVTGILGKDFHKFRPDAVPNNIGQPLGPDGQPIPSNPDQNVLNIPRDKKGRHLSVAPSLPVDDPASVRTSKPEFPGETPCVNPEDNSQYYTKGTATCQAA